MNRIVASFMVGPGAWEQFRALCADVSETPDTALRELVRLEIQRRVRRKPRGSEAPDEALRGRLRLFFAEALQEACDWPGCQAALRLRGLGIAPKGGGLVLLSLPGGRELAKASSVGPGYAQIARRFGCGLPGHSARARFPLPGATDGIDLIEPF